MNYFDVVRCETSTNDQDSDIQMHDDGITITDQPSTQNQTVIQYIIETLSYLFQYQLQFQ